MDSILYIISWSSSTSPSTITVKTLDSRGISSEHVVGGAMIDHIITMISYDDTLFNSYWGTPSEDYWDTQRCRKDLANTHKSPWREECMENGMGQVR